MVIAQDDDWQAGQLKSCGSRLGRVRIGDRCKIEHIAEGWRVIADGPFFGRLSALALAEDDPAGGGDAAS